MDGIEEVDLIIDSNDVTESQDLFDSLPPAVPSKPSKPEIPTTLPLARIKRICKLDPNVKNITADAIKLITFCTEHFIEALAKAALVITREDGRKVCQLKDFQRAIRRSWLFYMLDGALEDWPEPGKAGGSAVINEKEISAQNEVVEVDAEGAVDIADDINVLEEDELNATPEGGDETSDTSIEKSDISVDDSQLTPKKISKPLRDIEDL